MYLCVYIYAVHCLFVRHRMYCNCLYPDGLFSLLDFVNKLTYLLSPYLISLKLKILFKPLSDIFFCTEINIK